MMKNKQGMSAVITTLIIILLVIVALGIIWVVVKNVINSGVKQVDLATKCRSVEITAVKIANTTPAGGSYNVTLTRTGAGDPIEGIKVTLGNTATNTYSEVLDFTELKILETSTYATGALTNAVPDANQIKITPYFLSDLGEEQVCQTTTTQEF